MSDLARRFPDFTTIDFDDSAVRETPEGLVVDTVWGCVDIRPDEFHKLTRVKGRAKLEVPAHTLHRILAGVKRRQEFERKEFLPE